MVEPWNVWMAFIPFLVMMLLLFDVVAPLEADSHRFRTFRWVLAIMVGSHCVQSHAGYLLIVVVALIGSGIVLLCETDRRRRVVVSGGVATALMWSAPLVDQLRRVPGNLTILREHFGSPAEPYIPLSAAVRIVTTQFNLFGPWLIGPEAHVSSNDVVRWFGFFAMVGLVLFALRSSRDREHRRILLLVNGVVLVAMLSVFRIFGPYYEYTVRFFWILVGLDVIICIRALSRGKLRTEIVQIGRAHV